MVEDEYQLTKNWSVTLPSKFNRRVEDDDLVIWKPGFTIWVATWANDQGESKEARLATLQQRISKDAFDIEVEPEKDVVRFCYRLAEKAKDKRVAAFYGFAIGANGHVQLGIYFDDENDLALARKIWLSLREKAAD